MGAESDWLPFRTVCPRSPPTLDSQTQARSSKVLSALQTV